MGKIDVLLGGRMAEEIVFGDISTGRRTICTGHRHRPGHGFRVRDGEGARALHLSAPEPTDVPESRQGPLVGKEYSEATAAKLDDEVKDLITERAVGVRELLTRYRGLLEAIAGELLKKEVMESEDFTGWWILTEKRKEGGREA